MTDGVKVPSVPIDLHSIDLIFVSVDARVSTELKLMSLCIYIILVLVLNLFTLFFRLLLLCLFCLILLM